MLSEDVINRRIALIASYNVNLDPAIRDVTTTRTFTSKQWGGNPQLTFPSIRPDMLARHGLDDFMYLNLYFNPHAPQWPGAPGLFFACSIHPETSEWVPIERVLVRLKTNCWFYVGQYQCMPAPSLTPEEWKSQSPKVNYPVSELRVASNCISGGFSPSGQADVGEEGLNAPVGDRYSGKNRPSKEVR